MAVATATRKTPTQKEMRAFYKKYGVVFDDGKPFMPTKNHDDAADELDQRWGLDEIPLLKDLPMVVARLSWRYAPLPPPILDDPKLSDAAVRIAAMIARSINLGVWNQDLHVDLSYAEIAAPWR